MNCVYNLPPEVPEWLKRKYEALGCDCLMCESRHLRVCMKSRPIIEFEQYDPLYEELASMMAKPGVPE